MKKKNYVKDPVKPKHKARPKMNMTKLRKQINEACKDDLPKLKHRWGSTPIKAGRLTAGEFRKLCKADKQANRRKIRDY